MMLHDLVGIMFSSCNMEWQPTWESFRKHSFAHIFIAFRIPQSHSRIGLLYYALPMQLTPTGETNNPHHPSAKIKPCPYYVEDSVLYRFEQQHSIIMPHNKVLLLNLQNESRANKSILRDYNVRVAIRKVRQDTNWISGWLWNNTAPGVFFFFFFNLFVSTTVVKCVFYMVSGDTVQWSSSSIHRLT